MSEQIAGNSHINATIYRCFDYICEEDKKKFLRKFRKQPHDSDQIMHTFRELILGAFLGSNGFQVRHDYVIDAKTPDWSILNNETEVECIIELTNFHLDKSTEEEIEEQLRNKPIAWVWRDQNKDNIDRLYHCIWHKAQIYRSLVAKLKIPYVIAVFGEFQAAIDFEDELCPCLFDEESGLFAMYPEVSGVLYFEESFGRYSFSFVRNSGALSLFNLPSGVFNSKAA